MTNLITRPREEHGIVAANLTIVIGLALFAVIMLTRTLLAANSIDDRVKIITTEVGGIDNDLDMVRTLDDTDRIAADILTAAAPLTGQAGRIVDLTASIDGTGTSILNNATSINGIVKGINGNVNGILGSVGPINSNAREINAKLGAVDPVVKSIDDGVAQINRRADVVIVETTEIDNDLTNVDNLLKSVAVSATGICGATVLLATNCP